MSFSAPIRIAFCITELDPGGAERALVELATRLDRQCFEPAVFCLGPRAALVEPLERANIPVTCLGAKRARDVWVVFRLAKALRKFQPALLQTWLYHANILGRLAGRLVGVPKIVSGIRVAEHRSRGRLWLDRITQSLVDVHVCVSQGVAEYSTAAGGLCASRVRIIPNGVEAERFANAPPADLSLLGIPGDSPCVVFVGRLDPQKDPLWLLEVFPRLQQEISGVHLVFVGQGPLESRLRDQIQQRHLESFVHVLGWRVDIPDILKSAHVLALPSRWEGMPNIVLEAFASGLPVVATAVEGVSELITPGETGFLFPSQDSEQFVRSVAAILGNPALKTKMGQEAQALVANKFTWEINCQSYANLYRELLQDQA
jgi:glycosyltransferase involved in cell wall biosynthesis